MSEGLRRLYSNEDTGPGTDALREKIQRQVDEYLARGGKIQQIETGKSGANHLAVFMPQKLRNV